MLEDAAGIRRVVLACGTVDLRKGIDGLATIIGDKYGQNPFEKGTLFLFCGKRSDRCKGLLWMGTGFLLLYKRFEAGRLSWPRNTQEVKVKSFAPRQIQRRLLAALYLAWSEGFDLYHLSASAQRFALIITSLQIFRLALANKLEEIKANSEYSSDFDKVINILTDNKYIAEASKILVDNLIDTMERINYKADALKNYKLFIEDIKNGKINWVAKTYNEFKNNKSKYIGYFIKKGKDLLNAKLFIMPDKGYEWLILNYDKVTSDFDIQAYINEMNKPFKSDIERNNKIKELTGFNIRSNVADIITAEDKKRLGYVYAPASSYLGSTKTSIFWYNEDGIEQDEINELLKTRKKDKGSKKEDKKEDKKLPVYFK